MRDPEMMVPAARGLSTQVAWEVAAAASYGCCQKVMRTATVVPVFVGAAPVVVGAQSKTCFGWAST